MRCDTIELQVTTNSPDDDNEEVKPSLEERIVERYFNENLQVK
jgi:hypothetical protein